MRRTTADRARRQPARGHRPEGKIFRVSGDPARATLSRARGARQVTALLREPSGRIVGATSNPGKIFALSAQIRRSEGQLRIRRARRRHRGELGRDPLARDRARRARCS